MTRLSTLVLLMTVSLANAGWASRSPRPMLRPTPSAPRERAQFVPKPGRAPAWSHLQSGLTYLGVGGATAGLGLLASVAAGPGAAAIVAGSVALPLVVSLVEFMVLGGPRIARIMGGEPADTYLATLVRGVAHDASLSSPAHIFEIPTKEMNAFAAGMFLRDSTVAVTSGLRAALSEQELKAVIAHEMGHLRHSDVARNMHLAAAAAGLGGLYQGGRALLRSSSSKGSKKKDDSGSAVALGVGMMAAGLGAQTCAHLIRLGLGRGAEFAADRVAAELYGPDALVSALRKIETRGAAAKRDSLGVRGNAFAHLFIAPEPGAAPDTHKTRVAERKPWWSWQRLGKLLSTHPSMEERVDALQALRLSP